MPHVSQIINRFFTFMEPETLHGTLLNLCELWTRQMVILIDAFQHTFESLGN